MPRLFHRRMNVIARASLLAIPILAATAGGVAWHVQTTSYVTSQDITMEQPVPFSHKHHVGELGIDCRYCHTSVTDSSFAGLPPTKTCMTCHSQIWTNAAMLQPVRDSWRTGVPLQWQRVHNLPEYVYFDHSIHVAKGVGCATCHGQVDEMPLMFQAKSLEMSWCLECHRHPEEYLRPREEVFNLHYQSPPDQLKVGRELAERYHVRSAQALTDCYTCHR
ncbi:MAG TPA: cytochrome c3 family protein [Tepidisphaeraceae bacterium]|jgi:hypothetical protein|nr:cytochrome c3 family protein [Tepidisphaeraceae bacterium]